MTVQEYQREGYTVSTDPSRLDVALIYDFLSQQSYWAQNRTRDIVQRSITNSLNFGLYCGTEQVGFARVVTDKATFAWVCDVFVLPAHRGHGLGKWLVDCITNHPELQPVRRILLATRDAHGLYQQYGGFKPLANPDRWLEKYNPDV